MGRKASLASHAIDGARREPTEFCDVFGSDKGFHLSQYCLATGAPKRKIRCPRSIIQPSTSSWARRRMSDHRTGDCLPRQFFFDGLVSIVSASLKFRFTRPSRNRHRMGF
jgi:hypothetical protein